MKCKYCKDPFETKNRLRTHLLTEHPKEVTGEDGDFEIDVSEGRLKERDVEKGEQFGYEKGR